MAKDQTPAATPPAGTPATPAAAEKTLGGRVETLETTMKEMLKALTTINATVGEIATKQAAAPAAAAAPGTAAKKTVKFGGKGQSGPMAVFDTKTNIAYPSKASAGKAVVSEYKDKNGAALDIKDTFVWYKIIAADPTRFRDATPEETAKVQAERKATQEKEKAEAQAKLDAEAAANPPAATPAA
jgi:hypothetical protein